MRHSLVVALLAVALPCAAQGKQITLEELLSAPFPDGLVASPSGGVVAWTFDEGGSRNVWVARPPDYKASRITSYHGDDGQEIAELTFTPDGSAIAYVRGGSANGHGEIPNPALDVAGETQAVWLVPLQGGAPRRIGDGHSPAIPSSGGRIELTGGNGTASRAFGTTMDLSTGGREWYSSALFRRSAVSGERAAHSVKLSPRYNRRTFSSATSASGLPANSTWPP